MHTTSNESARDVNMPDSVADGFLDFIEERYREWDGEFGEEVHLRRVISLDPEQ